MKRSWTRDDLPETRGIHGDTSAYLESERSSCDEAAGAFSDYRRPGTDEIRAQLREEERESEERRHPSGHDEETGGDEP